MSGNSFTSKSFDPALTQVLTKAFDTAWETIKGSGSPLAAPESAAATRDELAKHIIAAANEGKRDPARLSEYAIGQLVSHKLPPGD